MRVVRLARVTRVMRILRVLRIVRVVHFVVALRQLVYSVIISLKMLLWAAILLSLLIYIFAVVFTSLYEEQDQGTDFEAFWGSINISFVTLFQSVSGGLSWAAATEQLRLKHFIYEMLFILYITISYFALLNVVTGVFCSCAIAAAEMEPEIIAMKSVLATKKTLILEEKLFNMLDLDASGMITIDELEESLRQSSVIAFMHALNIEADDVLFLFNLLDADKNGLIDVQEFVAGCSKLTGNSTQVHLTRIGMHQRWMMKRLERLTASQPALIAL